MNDDLRIDVDVAREHSAARRALLVCAYDDDEKCRKMRIKGALTMREFRKSKTRVDKRDEIILYCA
jgi:hypothetical protein